MKTPRQILMERHGAMAEKLDRVRESVLRRELAPATSRVGVKHSLAQVLWEQLIFPCRNVWAGLAALWVAIAIANYAQETPRTRTVPQPISRWESDATVLGQQRQLFAEWNGVYKNEPIEPPKAAMPRRRSHLPQEFMIG